jgi:hypothetical protein
MRPSAATSARGPPSSTSRAARSRIFATLCRRRARCPPRRIRVPSVSHRRRATGGLGAARATRSSVRNQDFTNHGRRSRRPPSAPCRVRLLRHPSHALSRAHSSHARRQALQHKCRARPAVTRAAAHALTAAGTSVRCPPAVAAAGPDAVERARSYSKTTMTTETHGTTQKLLNVTGGQSYCVTELREFSFPLDGGRGGVSRSIAPSRRAPDPMQRIGTGWLGWG